MFNRIAFIGIGFFLLLSAFLPTTRELWEQLDIFIFTSINPLLAYEPFGFIVAFLNSRFGDWISHLSFVALLVVAIADRKKALYSLLTLTLTIVIVIVGVKTGVSKRALDFKKDSPSLKVERYIDIGTRYSLPNNHTTSKRSFPGDHATTILLAATWISIASRQRLAFLAFSLVFVFALPRLFAGAHGLSDIIAGSGGIVLLFTPFLQLLVAKIQTSVPLKA